MPAFVQQTPSATIYKFHELYNDKVENKNKEVDSKNIALEHTFD